MRTVNFVQEIVYGMAHLLGIDPEQDLLKDHARAWVASINSKVRYGWSFWPWPELEITEERAFRQVWYTDVKYKGGQGEESEVYYPVTKTYHRAYGTPEDGTIPSNSLLSEVEIGRIVPPYQIPPDGLYRLSDAEVGRHVAFDQFGKRAIEEVTAVNRTDPRSATNSRKWDWEVSARGIDLPFASGPTVWLTFKPPPPVFTSTTWSNSKPYMRGDIVLDLDTGECYIALKPSTDKAVNLTGYWLRQDFPYVLSEYVTADAAADQTDDLQAKADLRAQAQEALASEIRKLGRQGQRTKYRQFGLGTRRQTYLPRVELVT